MKNLFILFVFLSLSFLSGCGGVQMISVDMKCDENCNGNNAIVVKIYQLKNGDKFRNASFESMISNPEEVLGDDLIVNSKYEKTLVPEESFMIDEYEIKPEAIYLGIVGDFFSPAKDSWRQIIQATDVDNIKITVHESSISVDKE